MSKNKIENNPEVSAAWNQAVEATITPMLEQWSVGKVGFVTGYGNASQAGAIFEQIAAEVLQKIALELLQLREEVRGLQHEVGTLQEDLEHACEERDQALEELALWETGQKVHPTHEAEATAVLDQLRDTQLSLPLDASV